nr:hypothetical protein [Klebsiella variicola]
MEYLLSEDGGGAKRFFLLGTDYVIRAPPTRSAPSCMPKDPDKDIEEVYTPVRL